jgi:branched-chain amino acid transport system permease protein
MRAAAGAIWGADDKGFNTPYSGMTISLGGGEGANPIVIGVPSVIIICGTIVMIAALYLFFRYTKIGVAMLAASQNQLAAYYMGIPVKVVFSLIWAISAAVATIAGILLAPKLQVFSPEVGLLSITAFAAAVIGGFGSLPGAIVGGLIIGVAEALSTRYLPDILIGVGLEASFANKIPVVIAYIIMLAVLIVRPQGLFAQIQRKKV